MAFTDEDKQWLTAQLNGRLEELETKLLTAMSGFVTNEKLEAMETRLLTEFHKWASPSDNRMRIFKEVLHTFDLELDRVKDRLHDLDGKI